MRIKLATSKGVAFEVDAQGTGEWAIHREPFQYDSESDRWTVTHVPTGLAIPRRMTRAQAGDLASRLSRDLPTLGIETSIWSTGTHPTVQELGPGYTKLLDRFKSIVAEVLGS
jgi:hypothetical protein